MANPLQLGMRYPNAQNPMMQQQQMPSAAPSWFDQVGTNIGDSLIHMQNPFGMGAPVDPSKRGQIIGPQLLQLAGAVDAAGRKGAGPFEGLAQGITGLQTQGLERSNAAGYAEQIAGNRESRQEKREYGNRWKQFVAQMEPGGLKSALEAMPPDEGFNLYAKMQGGQNKRTQVVNSNNRNVLIDMDTGQPIADLGMAPSRQQSASPGYRWTDETQTKQEAIPGGPATKMPAEVAGRVAMLDTAEQSMAEAEQVFMKPYDSAMGGIRSTAEYYSNSGEYGRATRTVRMAIEAGLRAMTGAAAPESEVRNYENMFLPLPYDGLETTKQKLGALKQFMAKAKAIMMQGRTTEPDQAQPMPEPTQQLQPGTIEDGYRYNGGDPADPASWEPVE